MTTEVLLERIWHNKQERLAIRFEYDANIVRGIHAIAGRTFSGSLRVWHVPFTSNNLQTVIDLLEANHAKVTYHDSFYKTNQILAEIKTNPLNGLSKLNENHAQPIEAFKLWMQSKRYSDNTIATYCDALKTFLRYFSDKEINEISNNDVIAFNNDYILKNKLSSSFQNQVVNAIKLFYRTMSNKNLEVELVHRPKRERVLPNVLSKEETKAILGALRNLKHKTMLSLIYSCGLRRGELLNLKLKDIDSNRKLILIRQAKGKKDRIVPLSEKILNMMREYYKAYKPKYWLFEGQNGNGPYDERSLASALKNAVEKAKIGKAVTLHWLRHSYATHLLENGTDLRYIQEILGHSRSTTTEIYTHVSTKGIQNVVSPFDTL
jgi:integrase/recombinase XerD